MAVLYVQDNDAKIVILLFFFPIRAACVHAIIVEWLIVCRQNFASIIIVASSPAGILVSRQI
jgi:hypothetical protein